MVGGNGWIPGKGGGVWGMMILFREGDMNVGGSQNKLCLFT